MSPAALVACLAVLPRFGSLSIALQSWASRADPMHLPPERRIVLPALTSSFKFEGECTAAHIWRTPRFDTPRLDSIDIINRLDFRVPQLSGFIDHSALRSQAISVRACGDFLSYHDPHLVMRHRMARTFTSVKLLRVSGEYADGVARAFKGVIMEIAAQVLPALDLLCSEDQVARTIKKLFAIFRGCGLTLAIVSKERPGFEGGNSENDPYWY